MAGWLQMLLGVVFSVTMDHTQKRIHCIIIDYGECVLSQVLFTLYDQANFITKGSNHYVEYKKQVRDRAWFARLYGEIISEGIIDLQAHKPFSLSHLYVISSVDLACYGVSRAKIGYLWIVVQEMLQYVTMPTLIDL